RSSNPPAVRTTFWHRPRNTWLRAVTGNRKAMMPTVQRLVADGVLRKYKTQRQLYLFAFSVALATASFIVLRILLRILGCAFSPESCAFEIVPKQETLAAAINHGLFLAVLCVILLMPAIFVAWRFISALRWSKRNLAYSPDANLEVS